MIKRILPAIALCLVMSAGVASAQTPTPTATATATPTPTATATPSACLSLQDCIDTAVPISVAGCASTNSECTDTKTEKYAVTAGQLAERAINKRKCSNKRTRAACNVCYNLAKAPLQLRFKFDIFRGLLAQSVRLIEAERKETCPALNAGNS